MLTVESATAKRLPGSIGWRLRLRTDDGVVHEFQVTNGAIGGLSTSMMDSSIRRERSQAREAKAERDMAMEVLHDLTGITLTGARQLVRARLEELRATSRDREEETGAGANGGGRGKQL